MDLGGAKDIDLNFETSFDGQLYPIMIAASLAK